MKNGFVRQSISLSARLVASGVLLAACSSHPAAIAPPEAATSAPAQSAHWPTDGWRTSTPEEQGMDSQLLTQMANRVREDGPDLHSLRVVRNGYIVSETHFSGFEQYQRIGIFSCAKSVVSTLVGIAMDREEIDRLDRPFLDFFPDRTIGNPDPRKEDMKLEDVLAMRTGMDWQEGDAFYQELGRSKDWVQYMLDRPMTSPPGTAFNYCSGCLHLLSAALQEATGMTARAFADQYLFEPLGIGDASWDADPQGISIGGWSLQLTPRDMAKLGYLYLRNGEWDGRQIVSAQWVRTATQKHADMNPPGSIAYGYQWWLYPQRVYAALGLYGQMIFAVPESDLIVVMTAAINGHDEEFRLIDTYIYPAIWNPR
jgi:CubicO group peptidase (beta-lactamase class C family)